MKVKVKVKVEVSEEQVCPPRPYQRVRVQASRTSCRTGDIGLLWITRSTEPSIHTGLGTYFEAHKRLVPPLEILQLR